jgi:hypothetical protein
MHCREHQDHSSLWLLSYFQILQRSGCIHETISLLRRGHLTHVKTTDAGISGEQVLSDWLMYFRRRCMAVGAMMSRLTCGHHKCRRAPNNCY